MTFFHVPWRPGDQTGIQRRFSSSLRALHRVSSEITLLHMVPEAQIVATGPIAELERSQSAFWGVPVRIALVPRRERAQTWWRHYGAGVFSAGQQPGHYAFSGPAVAEAVGRHLDAEPDLVFAHRLLSFIPILNSGRRPPRLVLDIDDIEHRVLARRALTAPFRPGKSSQLLQVPALYALERRAIAASRLALACSETDRAYLRRTGFPDVARVVPNALPLPATPPGLVAAPTMLFLGDMRNGPNRFGAERMVHRIWPLVRDRVPDARLFIAGRFSDVLPSAASGLPGVEHLGFAPDLDALYAASRAVVCPIVTGGGTRLKLVEAGGYARPIVSTVIGAEGLDYVDGRTALLRDDDQGFADACVELLRDDALCRRLGAAAHALVASRYDARVVEDRLAALLADVLADRVPGDWAA